MAKVANLLTTHRCNLACEFCLNVWKDSRLPFASRKDFATTTDYFQQTTILERLAKGGIEIVVFTGGEPLLNTNLASLIDKAHSLGMKSLIQTNGEFLARDFLSKIAGRVIGIQVSLEGPRDIHNMLTRSGNFDRVVSNMRLAKEMGFFLMTNFTITKRNMDCLEACIILLEDIGVDMASFTRMYPSGMAMNLYDHLQPDPKEMAAFFRELSSVTSPVRIFIQGGIPSAFFEEQGITLARGGCGAVRNEIAIQPNGDLTMCPSSPVILGNILWQSLKDILASPAAAAVVDEHRSCDGCLLLREENQGMLDAISIKSA